MGVNGDDPLLFGPGLLEEYQTCRTARALSDSQLAAVATSSRERSGAPPELLATALAGVRKWLCG